MTVTVGDLVRFFPAKDGVATVLEAEQNPLTGKWRYLIEYVGGVTGETTTQWVGGSAIRAQLVDFIEDDD